MFSLNTASNYGHDQIVESLIANKASINLKDNHDNTPLILGISKL